MRAAVVVVLAIGLGGCGALISSQQEIELGQGVDGEIEREYRIVADNDPVAKWARALVDPLVKASTPFRDPKEIDGYSVEVIADDELVNAFAAPGGYTYISTGLILRAETCGEIAGVMGHELAHVTQRHGVRQLELAMAGEQLAALFLDEGLAKDAAQTVWGFLQATRFSREHEAESDAVGLQIAHEGGYNPFGLVQFFESMKALEKEAGGSPPEFLSSHPATDNRIRDVSRAIRERYGDSVSADDAKSFECRRTNLSLADVQKRILDGALKIRKGTGTEAEGDDK